MESYDYKVTVYITNYNYGQYIRKAIESVLNQSFSDFELIIIDDGSTDNSKDIIEEYQYKDNIKIIYQKNKGLNITNNVALRSSSGQYIVRLDADDYLHQDALKILSEKLDADPELGLVFPDYYLVDDHDHVYSEAVRHDFDSEVKLLDQAAHGACTMIRTSFLRDVGGYNEAYNCQDGYELWVKFIHHFKVSNVNKPLFYYRQHGNNLTGNENRILDTRARINADFIEEFSHTPNAIVVIPIRGGAKDLAFSVLGGQTLLERKIDQVIQATQVAHIVVSSPDENVRNYIHEDYLNSGKVLFHHRNLERARLNESLAPTVDDVLKMPGINRDSINSICVLTVEYPFLKPHKIDDAINTMFLFKSDSLISVRSDNSIFYQHHGDGMHPILNQDEYTKLEREALFKQVGGITVVKADVFLNEQKLICGTVGHMVIDEESAFGVFSVNDLRLAQLIESASNLV